MKQRSVCLIAAAAMLLCSACADSADSPAASGAQNTGTQASAAPPQSESNEAPQTDLTTGSPASDAPGSHTAEQTADTPQETTQTSAEKPAPTFTVRAAEWADVQWTQFQCAYFTLKIPQGWKVEWKGNSEALAWQATAGDGSMLGLSNVDHLTASKNQQMASILGQSFFLENGSVPELFSKLFADTTDYFKVENSCVPANKDMLQSLRRDKAIWDYQSLYATFAENGVKGEGIYSAVIMEAPDLILTGGYNYAMWEINAVFTEYAPVGELVNWQPVLNQIAQSFTYTDYYWQEMMSRIGSRQEPMSTASDTDPVMEAFEERMTQDTIIQEKRSDMIGEYERVYDSETGNIYRAYDGFLDDIGTEQKRYTPITDSQYADGYVGWIDK